MRNFIRFCSPKLKDKPFDEKAILNAVSKTKCIVTGPLWLGKLHDESTLDRIFSKIDILKNETHKRKITKLIPRFKEEDIVSIPYFFDIARTADRLDVTTPSIDFVMENLIRLGFTAYRTHFSHTGVKTNAPRDVFSDIVSQKI